MAAITPTAAADDTRPILKFIWEHHTSPVAPKVLAAMQTGGFYARRRRGLKDALWRSTERGTFAPVRVAQLQAWIGEHFRCWDESRGAYVRAPRQLASWILLLVGEGLSGFAVITDKTVELL